MDQFSAHLDRGWDLVQRGDSQGAEVSARRALELDSQSPEAHNLLGYVCALQGDFEEAIENYRQAIALDDGYLEAILNAAEVYIHPLAEYDRAAQMCDMALDLAENDDERVDALLLKFDALLGQSKMDEAKLLCERFPAGPFENSTHAFLVGRAFYEVGQLDRATPLIEDATKHSSTNAECWYYLGLVRDEHGDRAGAANAFLRSRELDLALPPPTWTLTSETFQRTAQRALDALESDLKQRIAHWDIYVADMPGVEAIVDGVDPRALLLLDAGPAETTEDLHARLFVYQRNLERLAGAVDTLEEELSAALERELVALFSEESESDEDPDRARTLN